MYLYTALSQEYAYDKRLFADPFNDFTSNDKLNDHTMLTHA